MARTIVVTSNCQTFGIAAALAAIYPDDVVIPLHGTEAPDELPPFDVVVADRFNQEFLGAGDRLMARAPRSVQVVTFSRVRFGGFHPDLCYLRRRSTGAAFGGYRSAIALWAYANGLDAASAETMFCEDVYRSLGYHACYDLSVDRLRQDFEETDVSFERFFLSVKRTGVFMHTYNHPKIVALVHLARLIAEKIGLKGACATDELGIADGLTSHIWPIYPEIADDLALPGGSYDWRLGGPPVRGVRDYLRAAFADLEALGVERADIELRLVNGIGPDAYDRVLGSRAGLEQARP